MTARLNAGDLTWDTAGLIPTIVQDAGSLTVLMLGYMNREALDLTLDTGQVWFWSRSRGKLWRKGETSGNTLTLQSIHVNCEENSLLVQARPNGPTCHTGNPTCFYRELAGPSR